jgi:hypothetical protein
MLKRLLIKPSTEKSLLKYRSPRVRTCGVFFSVLRLIHLILLQLGCNTAGGSLTSSGSRCRHTRAFEPGLKELDTQLRVRETIPQQEFFQLTYFEKNPC